jgi:hypothetical protein
MVSALGNNGHESGSTGLAREVEFGAIVAKASVSPTV